MPQAGDCVSQHVKMARLIASDIATEHHAKQAIRAGNLVSQSYRRMRPQRGCRQKTTLAIFRLSGRSGPMFATAVGRIGQPRRQRIAGRHSRLIYQRQCQKETAVDIGEGAGSVRSSGDACGGLFKATASRRHVPWQNCAFYLI